MLDHSEGWQRFSRTELYRELGVFWCADVLVDCGIERPAEQMVALCTFVTDGLGKAAEVPPVKDRHALDRWARARLEEVAEKWKRGSLIVGSWHWMLVESQATIVWNPYRELSALLDLRCGRPAFDQAIRQLHNKGFDVRLDTALDLECLFFRRRLPRAFRSFDPWKGAGHEVKWLSTVFYRFALEELCSDRVNRLQVDLLYDQEVHQESAEDLLIRRESGELMEKMAGALSTLDAAQRTALEHYFGFGGPERRLIDIGRALGISEYRARSLITEGLATLSIRLGVEGILEDTEQRFARLLFLDGMQPSKAANQLHVDKTAVTRKINAKFRRALRARTLAAESAAERPRPRESIMPRNGGSPVRQAQSSFPATAHGSALALPTAEVRAAIARDLRALKEAPRIIVGPSDALVISLGDGFVTVEAVRQTLWQDEKLRAELQEQDLPIAWLLDPDKQNARLDLPVDAAFRSDLLNRVGQRRWVIAEIIYHECVSLSGLPASELFDEDDSELSVERLLRTMAGVAQIIESVLSRDLRRKGEAVFRVEKRGADKVIGFWLDDAVKELDLLSLVHDRAEAVGEIGVVARPVVARTIANGLLEGQYGLPGLHVADDADGDSCSLIWQSPSLEREKTADPRHAGQRFM